MKIAIKGHESRGKEVIQILESLGGKNREKLRGFCKTFYYINDKNEIVNDHMHNFPPSYKLYTLEEFEKEFPFKIGDKVIDYEGDIAVITGFAHIKEKLGYSLHYENGGRGTATPRLLEPYKEMKVERNITLTLDKAKEWYKKGGELREIALQAYSEEELNKVELPKTWEEFCNNYPMKDGMSYIDDISNIKVITSCDNYDFRDKDEDKNLCPSKKSAEAHLAMIQLEQLRDCWRQGWKPTEHDTGYCIIKYPEKHLIMAFSFISFLSFPTKEMAEEFFKCFRDLIEKAGDLI